MSLMEKTIDPVITPVITPTIKPVKDPSKIDIPKPKEKGKPKA